jgi:hypothetical protein
VSPRQQYQQPSSAQGPSDIQGQLSATAAYLRNASHAFTALSPRVEAAESAGSAVGFGFSTARGNAGGVSEFVSPTFAAGNGSTVSTAYTADSLLMDAHGTGFRKGASGIDAVTPGGFLALSSTVGAFEAATGAPVSPLSAASPPQPLRPRALDADLRKAGGADEAPQGRAKAAAATARGRTHKASDAAAAAAAKDGAAAAEAAQAAIPFGASRGRRGSFNEAAVLLASPLPTRASIGGRGANGKMPMGKPPAPQPQVQAAAGGHHHRSASVGGANPKQQRGRKASVDSDASHRASSVPRDVGATRKATAGSAAAAAPGAGASGSMLRRTSIGGSVNTTAHGSMDPAAQATQRRGSITRRGSNASMSSGAAAGHAQETVTYQRLRKLASAPAVAPEQMRSAVVDGEKALVGTIDHLKKVETSISSTRDKAKDIQQLIGLLSAQVFPAAGDEKATKKKASAKGEKRPKGAASASASVAPSAAGSAAAASLVNTLNIDPAVAALLVRFTDKNASNAVGTLFIDAPQVVPVLPSEATASDVSAKYAGTAALAARSSALEAYLSARRGSNAGPSLQVLPSNQSAAAAYVRSTQSPLSPHPSSAFSSATAAATAGVPAKSRDMPSAAEDLAMALVSEYTAARSKQEQDRLTTSIRAAQHKTDDGDRNNVTITRALGSIMRTLPTEQAKASATIMDRMDSDLAGSSKLSMFQHAKRVPQITMPSAPPASSSSSAQSPTSPLRATLWSALQEQERQFGRFETTAASDFTRTAEALTRATKAKAGVDHVAPEPVVSINVVSSSNPNKSPVRRVDPLAIALADLETVVSQASKLRLELSAGPQAGKQADTSKAARPVLVCVECESKPSERVCLECQETYCTACFDTLHKKGKRKDHSWELIASASAAPAPKAETRTSGDRRAPPPPPTAHIHKMDVAADMQTAASSGAHRRLSASQRTDGEDRYLSSDDEISNVEDDEEEDEDDEELEDALSDGGDYTHRGKSSAAAQYAKPGFQQAGASHGAFIRPSGAQLPSSAPAPSLAMTVSPQKVAEMTAPAPLPQASGRGPQASGAPLVLSLVQVRDSSGPQPARDSYTFDPSLVAKKLSTLPLAPSQFSSIDAAMASKRAGYGNASLTPIREED